MSSEVSVLWTDLLVGSGMGPDLVGSGMGTYAGTARRRVHLAFICCICPHVLLRPPSGHCPGRRQARHARIPEIRLLLT